MTNLDTARGGAKRMFGKKRVRTALFLTAVLAYPVLQFCVFYVGVNFNSILLAFKTFDPEAAAFRFTGFGNFRAFFRDLAGNSVLIRSALNSITLYVAGLLIGFPLNLVFSFFLYKKIPGSGFFRVVLFLPQIISPIVMSLMFKYFVDRAIPTMLKAIGFIDIPMLLVDKATAFPTMIFYTIWAGFGSAIIIYTSAMSRISDSLVEYGRLEGMSLFKEFWHVTIPMIFPTITTFLVVGVAGIFTNQASVYNFWGGNASYGIYTLGYYFFIKVVGNGAATNFGDFPYAAAAGLVFTLLAVPLTLLVRFLLEKYGPSPEY